MHKGKLEKSFETHTTISLKLSLNYRTCSSLLRDSLTLFVLYNHIPGASSVNKHRSLRYDIISIHFVTYNNYNTADVQLMLRKK